ncbi:MAG: radical SAM protein [Candidatus Hadarchaeales archaeon]
MAYTAALLEKIPNTEVHVLDSLALDLNREEFYRRCEQIQPDLVVAETSAVTFYNDMEILRNLKEELHSKIVVTGPHATVLYKEILRDYAHIDYVALGEYELSVAELVEKWGNGEVAGFAIRKGEEIVTSPRPLLKDLDTLPMPSWHLFPMEEYNEPFCTGYPNFQLLSSRGCLFKCVFCLYPQTMEFGTFRAHSPKRTVEEMKKVLREYHPKEIYFDDSTFTQDKKRVHEICNLIKEEGLDIKWSCMTHAGTMDREMVFEMAEAGCVAIKFGIESGCQAIINKIKKGLSLEHAKKVFRWCREAGIRTHATYMFGLPGDTRETIRQTLRFALELDSDSAQFSIATPYPGTEFYRMAEENGWLIERDWSKFDGNNYAVVSYPDLRAEELMEFLRYAQRRWVVHLMSKPKRVWCMLREACQTDGIAGLLRITARGLSNLGKFATQRSRMAS